MRLITGTLRSTPLPWLPVLSNIESAAPALQRKAATDKLMEKIVEHDSWPIQPDILYSPLVRQPLWLDLQPADVKSRWGSWIKWLIPVTLQSGNRVLTSLDSRQQWCLY